jgi:hypothetical protein
MTQFKCSHCLPGLSALYPTLDHLTSRYSNQEITNHSTILDNDEHEAARQLAMKAETELSALRTHIGDLISHLGMLRREAEHFKDALAHKTTISPIRILPPELISRIMLATLNIPEEDDLVVSLNPSYSRPLLPSTDCTSSPWALSQVCHTWREIALGCSPIWCHLYFDLREFIIREPITCLASWGRFSAARSPSLFLSR